MSDRIYNFASPWWRHQMEAFFALLAISAGNSPVTGEFPAQRPVKRSFDVFFDLRTNKRLSKQWWGWWFETPSSPLWRHCNDYVPWVVKDLIWLAIRNMRTVVWWLSNICSYLLYIDCLTYCGLDESIGILLTVSFPPSAAYMRHWIGSALVQIMACRLFGTEPQSEPVLEYC